MKISKLLLACAMFVGIAAVSVSSPSGGMMVCAPSGLGNCNLIFTFTDANLSGSHN